VAWHSFQFEAVKEPPLPGLLTLGDLLKGFPNTAYALSKMDLVITVDTVLAHLAGAMGIPTFLLLSFIPDWRWMLGRKDSPWYPTLRLYRQSAPGDWSSVIRQVIEELSSG
jgi:ADP-heptose:LPS heptosyltransferase